MELDFNFDGVLLRMLPEQGISLDCSLGLKSGSKTFTLKSRQPLRDAVFQLHIHPLSQSPYREKQFPDNRIGEIGLAIYPIKAEGRRLFTSWMHAPDDQFSVLYAEISKRDGPSMTISLCFNEDDAPALKDGVFNDMEVPLPTASGRIPIMTYRIFVTII
jgi:hypothetical protein